MSAHRAAALLACLLLAPAVVTAGAYSGSLPPWTHRFVPAAPGQSSTPVTAQPAPPPSGPPAPASAVRTPTLSDWPTFGYDLSRSGHNPNETVISPKNVGSLHRLWSFSFPGNAYAAPVFANQVPVGGTPTDLVYQASEAGVLYALDVSSGTVKWQRSLGSVVNGCPAGENHMGISSTPVIDRASGRIYVAVSDAAGGHDYVYALDWASGATVTGWPVSFSHDPTLEHVWGALTLNAGKIYVEVASFCDLGSYHGRIMAIDTSTAKVTSYWVSTPVASGWGGLWGYGGVSVDAATGNVYAAVGNGPSGSESVGSAEHVVQLDPNLNLLAANYPGLKGLDVDFGNTPLLYQPTGCPLQLAAENKTGQLFVYNTATMAAGPIQSLQIGSGADGNLLDQATYTPTLNTVFISNPSDSSAGTYLHGLLAFKVQADCTLKLAWQASGGSNHDIASTPIVVNGVVYYGDGVGDQVIAVGAVSGLRLWASPVLGYVSAEPIVVNGHLYVASFPNTATGNGTLWSFGP